jgi:hypothetical protein
MPGVKSDYGTKLAKEWKVNAAHSLYDKNGEFTCLLNVSLERYSI